MLKIRKLEITDAQSLGRLAAACFSQPWSEKAFAYLAEDQNSLFFVAEDEGEIIGSCGLTRVLDEGDIHNVMVSEHYRGKGLATGLMEALLEEGSAAGIQDFTLEVRVSNAPAIRVYEKLGFVSEGIRPKFYEKPVEDAMIMWKRQ